MNCNSLIENECDKLQTSLPLYFLWHHHCSSFWCVSRLEFKILGKAMLHTLVWVFCKQWSHWLCSLLNCDKWAIFNGFKNATHKMSNFLTGMKKCDSFFESVEIPKGCYQMYNFLESWYCLSKYARFQDNPSYAHWSVAFLSQNKTMHRSQWRWPHPGLADNRKHRRQSCNVTVRNMAYILGIEHGRLCNPLLWLARVPLQKLVPQVPTSNKLIKCQ